MNASELRQTIQSMAESADPPTNLVGGALAAMIRDTDCADYELADAVRGHLHAIGKAARDLGKLLGPGKDGLRVVVEGPERREGSDYSNWQGESWLATLVRDDGLVLDYHWGTSAEDARLSALALAVTAGWEGSLAPEFRADARKAFQMLIARNF